MEETDLLSYGPGYESLNDLALVMNPEFEVDPSGVSPVLTVVWDDVRGGQHGAYPADEKDS